MSDIMTDYKELADSLAALTESVPYLISNLSNSAAVLWNSLDDINWAGFYIYMGDSLILGPFQGKPACIEILPGEGVCGTAFLKDEVQLVPDVHQFPGHIACDSASNSEIVIPIHKDGAVWGVLDIDSPSYDRFTQADKEGLSLFVSVLEKML